LLRIPLDVLSSVLQMMIAGRFGLVDMLGDELRYGRAKVRSYGLHMTIDKTTCHPSDRSFKSGIRLSPGKEGWVTGVGVQFNEHIVGDGATLI
jgi:hypothetical protein